MRLLKIELIKVLNNRTFWIILGLHFLLFVPVAFGIQSIIKSISFNANGVDFGKAIADGFKVFQFPDIWHNITYLASWFKLFLAIIIVIVTTNEYQFRTLKQNIIDGMSKAEVVLSKQLLIIVLSIFATLVIALLTLILGKNPENISIFDGSSYLLRYFISLILYLNFAYLLSTFIKKSGLTIGLLLIYTLLIENIIASQLNENIANFLPTKLIENFIPNPVIQHFGAAIADSFNAIGLTIAGIYLFAFIALIYWNIKSSKF